jgi:hypothetical protein
VPEFHQYSFFSSIMTDSSSLSNAISHSSGLQELSLEDLAAATGGSFIREAGRTAGRNAAEFYDCCVWVTTDYFEMMFS